VTATTVERTQTRHEKVGSHDQRARARPLADHLITPQNAAPLLIDYQPAQLAGVHLMDRAHLALARLIGRQALTG